MMAQLWRSVAENSTERPVTSRKMDIKKNTESIVVWVLACSYRLTDILLFFFRVHLVTENGREGGLKLFIENITVSVSKTAAW